MTLLGGWRTYKSCKNSTPPSLPTESRSRNSTSRKLQLFKWQMAPAGHDKVRAFRALMHSHGVRPEDVTPETQARVTARRSTTV